MRIKQIKSIISLVLVLAVGLVAYVSYIKPTLASEEQRRTLNRYLEGMKEYDYGKLQATAGLADLEQWPRDAKKLKEHLQTLHRETIGSIISWEIVGNPYVDQLNGQTIIRTKLVTQRFKALVLDFDLRKDGEGNWRTYGVKTIEKNAK